MIEKTYNENDVVYIVGGGASLEGFDFGQLHGLKCIVTNKAFRKVKYADALFFSDNNFDVIEGKSLWRFLGKKIYTTLKLERTEHTDKRVETVKLGFKPCNAGLGAIFLAIEMGAKKIVLLGFDCKYINLKQNWHSIEQISERQAEDTTMYNNMLKDFTAAGKKLKKFKKYCDIEIINASVGSLIECFPKRELSEYFKVPTLDIDGIEKAKYEKAWNSDKYSIMSPAMREGVARFLASKLKPKGGTLTDWGCGSGRASKELSGIFNVVALDITKTALDRDIKIYIKTADTLRFIEHNMWKPVISTADYAFSCDVLEHMPTKKVDAVLENIQQNTIKGGFFQIALNGHTFEGQELHLTVKPAGWWLTKVGKYFDVLDVEETEKHVCITFKLNKEA